MIDLYICKPCDKDNRFFNLANKVPRELAVSLAWHLWRPDGFSIVPINNEIQATCFSFAIDTKAAIIGLDIIEDGRFWCASEIESLTISSLSAILSNGILPYIVASHHIIIDICNDFVLLAVSRDDDFVVVDRKNPLRYPSHLHTMAA